LRTNNLGRDRRHRASGETRVTRISGQAGVGLGRRLRAGDPRIAATPGSVHDVPLISNFA
jgi:hypothetical protein